MLLEKKLNKITNIFLANLFSYKLNIYQVNLSIIYYYIYIT